MDAQLINNNDYYSLSHTLNQSNSVSYWWIQTLVYIYMCTYRYFLCSWKCLVKFFCGFAHSQDFFFHCCINLRTYYATEIKCKSSVRLSCLYLKPGAIFAIFKVQDLKITWLNEKKKKRDDRRWKKNGEKWSNNRHCILA